MTRTTAAATSSVRRVAQLLAVREDLQPVAISGTSIGAASLNRFVRPFKDYAWYSRVDHHGMPAAALGDERHSLDQP